MASILVLDSGVGGLSVCESILVLLSDIELIYFADDAYFPYGLLDESSLSERLNTIVAEMLKLHRPDIVVLACNTVSTLLLPELRERYHLPFVGVVPAIKPAASLSVTKRIALLATPATVVRPYTDDLINEFASDCEVIRIGSSELVEQAEKYLSGYAVDHHVIEKSLSPLEESDNKANRVDTLVLGCTHFPLIRDQIAAVIPGVKLVDSGKAIARRVCHLLSELKGGKDYLQGASQDLRGEFKEKDVVHQIYFSKMIPNEDVFSVSLKRIGIDNYQLHCFSASMD